MVAWPPGLRSVNSQPESYCDRKLTLRVGRLPPLLRLLRFLELAPIVATIIDVACAASPDSRFWSLVWICQLCVIDWSPAASVILSG